AVAVPLFTLFGPDGVALRVDDCRPRLLVVERDAERWQAALPAVRVVALDARFAARLHEQSPRYTPRTAADDPAVFQYTSGTTRALPEAVRHTHRAVVTLMVAALYGVGLERGDRYFCPSSPAWGHGLWHGTIAPLALGIAVGALAGRFDPARFAAALDAFAITNVAAAPTVYRMARAAGWTPTRGRIAKCSFTGEPMDAATREFLADSLGVAPCSMYGSTEVGVVLVDYPGFPGYVVRPGALGSPAPGWEVAVVDEAGAPVATGAVGEIAVRRRGAWFAVKDRGWMDADGYVHHAGRSDDVIISAGWTMSAVEIEQVLLRHPDVRDAAVIAVRDAARGQIPKAFVVAARGGDAFEREIEEWVRTRPRLGRRARGAADDPLGAGPHRVRVRRRAARHPRDVRRDRVPLAPADPRGRPVGGTQRPAAPGGKAVDVRAARDQADLPHHLRGPRGRRRRRGRLVVLPDRARHRARAQEVRAGRAAPVQRSGDRAHPRRLPRRAPARRHAALLGGRDDRGGAARGRQGPAHRDLDHRVRAGLGQPLRARARPGLRSLCASS